MNTLQIAGGVIAVIVGMAFVVFSSVIKQRVEAGEIPAEEVKYFTGFSGQKYEMSKVLGILIIAAGAAIALVAVVDYYMAIGSAT